MDTFGTVLKKTLTFSVSVEDVIFKLENNARLLMGWYTNNYLCHNPAKWHLLLSDNGNEAFVTIAQKSICNSRNEKILGVVFDSKLHFNCHIDKLCIKAAQKNTRFSQGVNLYESQTKESYHECLHTFSIQLLSIIHYYGCSILVRSIRK